MSVEAAGLVLALLSSCCLSWGFFRQHGTAAALPPLSVRRPLASLKALLSDRRWVVGFAVGIAGWALYVAALRLAPLSLVQAVSAGGIGVLALLVVRTSGVRLRRAEWGGVAAATVGLVLLGVSLSGGGGSSGHHGAPAAVALWIAVSLAVAGIAAGPIAPLLVGGAGFGLAAGVLYAAGDVATKAAVGGGIALVFTLVVLACHGLGFVALQLGFQRGGALATAGLSTLALNSLPIVAGASLFGETLPGGPLGAARLAAFACVVLGAALLSRSEPPVAGLAMPDAATPRQVQHRFAGADSR
jgi:hypothetical protein